MCPESDVHSVWTTQEQAAHAGVNVSSVLKVPRVLRGGTNRGTDNEFVISVAARDTAELPCELDLKVDMSNYVIDASS